MSPIDVDSDTFHAASAVFGADIGPRLSDAAASLGDGLSQSGAMAGSDEAGTTWAASYDRCATAVASAFRDAVQATFNMANLFEKTGFNHGRAESASTPGAPGATVATTDKTNYFPLTCTLLSAPSAAGGSGSSPTGWGLIEHLVGYAWPNGHQDRLRAAGAAWSTAAQALRTGSYSVSDGSAAIGSQVSPEVGDATRVTSAMGQHYATLASACDQLSTSCNQYAGHIDNAHSSVVHSLEILIAASVGTQVVGGIVSFFTVGLAEAPTQGAETAEIEATAADITATLAELSGEAATLAATADSAAVTVADTAPALQAVAAADVVDGGVDAAEALPAVANSAERSALNELENAAAKTETDAERVAQNRIVGKAAEDRVPGEQNYRHIDSTGKGAKYRVPDRLDPINKTMGEIKNVKYQHYSTQLRDDVAWAEANGYRFTLWVGKDTKLASTVQDAIDAGDINLDIIP